jgi:hypothetical protein
MYGLWQGGFGQIAPEFLIAKVPSILQKTSRPGPFCPPAQPRAISAPRNGIPQGGWLKHFSPCMIFGQGFPLALGEEQAKAGVTDSHDEPRFKIS